MAPLISVLLPTFNGALYLGQQLKSIVGQTHSDFEVLVIDDGSSDGTREIIQTFGSVDKRVIAIQSSGNLGQQARLRQLKSLAKGSYIAFSDQDDIWCFDKLEKLYRSIGSNSLAFGRSELVSREGKKIGIDVFEAMGNNPGPDFKLRALFRPLISAHCTLANKDIVSEQAFYRSDPFDWLIFLDAMYSGSVTYVPDAIVYHRIHENNQSNSNILRINSRIKPPIKIPRYIMRYGYVDRISFLGKLEYLASSDLLKVELKDTFRHVHAICKTSWVHGRGLGDLVLSGGLEKRVGDLLSPMAASKMDRDMLVKHVAQLTSAFLRLGQR